MKYILLLLIIIFPFKIFAQNNQTNTDTATSHRLHFAYGAAYNLKLDKTYSRLAKNGFNHIFYVGYAKLLHNKRIIDVQSSFMFGTLKTEGNNINTISNYAGNLKLRYLENIKSFSLNNFSVYLGANLDFKMDIWFPQNQQLRYAWDINLGAGFTTSLRYKIIPKLSLHYDLDIFLLGVLWRPHNNGQQLITEEIQLEKGDFASAFETPRFSHIFNTVYIDNSLQLYYAISKSIDIYYSFNVSYKYIKKPLIKKGYEFNNVIGITYKF